MTGVGPQPMSPRATASTALRRVRFAAWCLVPVVAAWAAWVGLRASQRDGREARHEEDSGPTLLVDQGPAPEFAFTDERGTPFSAADLRGRVWVADFFFTSCPDVCPRVTAAMAGLQRRLLEGDPAADPPFRLVSFTVDPLFDTPPVMAAYGRRFGADPRVWRFLTGPQDQVAALMEQGFRVAFGGPPEDPQKASLHYSAFVLVDARSRIRGYYDSDAAGVDRLHGAVRDLLARGGS